MGPQLLILRFAFCAAIPIYAAVAWFVSTQTPATNFDPQTLHIMTMALAVCFVGGIVAAPIVSAGKPAQPRFILRAAFYEAGAIYGLLLTFLSHQMVYIATFGPVAFLLILLFA